MQRADLRQRLFDEPFEAVAVDRFEVGALVGAGGMGRVYSARDPKLDRRVAIKVLHAGISPQRLAREAQAMARINHPQVVQVFDVGTTQEDELFVAMEFVDGETLEAWLKTGPSAREIVGVFVQAGEGLAAAHLAGVLHRDFKPSNVLLTPDKVAKVTDFGLAGSPVSSDGAAPIDVSPSSVDLTLTGTVLGTPAYMPPEQRLGERVDEAADQFAFCVALYEALFGQRPPTTQGAAAVRKAIASARRTYRRDRLRQQVLTVIERGLAWDPDARWPDVRVLVNQLRPTATRGSRLAYAAVAGFAVAGAAALLVGRTEAQPCPDRALEEVWGEPERAQLGAALRKHGGTHGAETWDRAAAALDEFANAWAKERTAACESADPTDSWVTCLDERRVEFGATVSALGEVNEATIDRAAVAAASMIPPAACRDAGESGPSSPDAARAQELIAKARVLRRTGAPESVRASEDAEAAADATGQPALRAAARILAAELLQVAGDYPGALAKLEAAFEVASSGGVNRSAAEAAARLIFVAGYLNSDPKAGERWSRQAIALLDRLDHAELIAAHYNLGLGLLRAQAGDADAALGLYETGLALRIAVLGPAHPEVAYAYASIGNHAYERDDYETARLYLTRALEITENAYGPHDPGVAMLLSDLGNADQRLGDLALAQQRYERALEIRQGLRLDHPHLSISWTNLGYLASERGDWVNAERYYRLRVEATKRRYGEESSRMGIGLVDLADAVAENGRLDEAHSLATRALVIAETTRGNVHKETGRCHAALAGIALRRGDFDHAEAEIARAEASWAQTDGADHPVLVQLRKTLVEKR